MKRIFTPLQIAFVGLIAICAASCQREKLNDVVKDQSFATVSASLPARLDIVKGGSYTLTGGDLTVPATINFSSATTSSFTVKLTTNTDTVATLVNSGVLAPGTVAFATGAAAVAPQITIPAGVTSFTFNVIISRSALEVNFGKTLAAVIKASAPTKGNKLLADKAAMIVTVKSDDIITAESIHDISFGVPNKIVDLSTSPSNYSLGSIFVTVSIPVVLNGDPGAQFTVNVVSSPDSVTKGIANGLLPGSVLFPDSKISIATPTVTVQTGTTTGSLAVNLKLIDLLAIQPAPSVPSNTKPTLAFTLTSSSKYQVTTTKVSTVYVVMDPNFFRPYYGKPFLIKGAIGAASDPIYCAYYDFGGEGIAFHDDTHKDGDGAWRSSDYVDVSGDYTPRSVVGWTGSGEWLTYSIYVEATGNYSMNTMIGGGGDGGTYSVFVDGVRYNQTPYPVTRTDYRLQIDNIHNIQLTKGYHILKMYWDHAVYDVRGMFFTRLAN